MRFSHIEYDGKSRQQQERATAICTELEEFIVKELGHDRASSLALTRLEECLMWVRKQIRDDQICRITGV